MEIATSTPGPTVRLDDPTLGAVWRGHDRAARLLAGAAGSAPLADGGAATARLAALVADLDDTRAGISRLNRLLAVAVRDVAEGLGRTDDDVAAWFRHGAGESS